MTRLVTGLKRLATFTSISLGAALLSSAASGQTGPVAGGTLVYLDPLPHTSLYPTGGGFYPNSAILNQITDKLTWHNPETLEIEPWIAESWTINADATEYVFRIRPGVTFSDGTPLDAEAVALNFDAYGLGRKEQGFPVSEVVNNYLRSEVLDPLTVKFTFSAPAPGFLQGTAVIASGLVAPSTLGHAFNDLGDATKIIGSGPFVVSAEVLGQSLTFAARTDYDWAPPGAAHQGRPLLDGIQLIVAREDSVRIGALLAGQADVIRQVQAYDEPQVTASNYVVVGSPTRGVNNGVTFRPENPLVADLRVRQALLHGTDAQEIIDTLFSEHYVLPSSVVSSAATGHADLSALLEFDPERAAALLDAAGWTPAADGIRTRDGARLELNIYENTNQPQNKATLQIVAQQWERLGVKLNVLSGDLGSAAVDRADPLRTPLVAAMVGRADPDVIKSFYHPLNRNTLLQAGGGSDKAVSFRDEVLNGLLDAVASAADPARRLELFAQAQRHTLEQAYTIPFFEAPEVFAAAPYVQGLTFDSVARPSFYTVWLDRR